MSTRVRMIVSNKCIQDEQRINPEAILSGREFVFLFFN